MKRKRYSVEQIVAAVKQHELGTSAADIARKLGIAEQTFYRWKKQYGGVEPGQARELKQLREENAKLKQVVANLSRDKAMLSDIAKKSGEGAATASSGDVFAPSLRGSANGGRVLLSNDKQLHSFIYSLVNSKNNSASVNYLALLFLNP